MACMHIIDNPVSCRPFDLFYDANVHSSQADLIILVLQSKNTKQGHNIHSIYTLDSDNSCVEQEGSASTGKQKHAEQIVMSCCPRIKRVQEDISNAYHNVY